jgi:hypothetical protein
MDEDSEKEDGMMFMVPDVLVARTEQVRRLSKDLSKAQGDHKIFLKQAIVILLESCDLKFSRMGQIKHDNVTPLN